ncbi:MAG TPA: FliI/YscN family ATPase [Phycisphaerales bacterium]|nr:FliI/YscN family ATPase [Phycisphaerales bacterium]
MSRFLADARGAVRSADPIRVVGSVAALKGLTLLVDDFPATVGSLVSVRSSGEARPGEVVGFEGRRTIVMMLGTTTGIRPGDAVVAEMSSPTIPIGSLHLGRVIDALGRPIDGGAMPRDTSPALIHPPPLNALGRARIRKPLLTGVRAIDIMTTVGRGQRMGIFAGPGVGKSTLLGMIARNTDADVNVIALIGERGREVREFIEEALGTEGLRRSVIVISTSDESPLMRVRAAMAACAAAEYFRDRGKHVMLMLDSVTRFAHAQRQIGLAVGEPPATRGYTPSVFALLPQMLERAGAVEPKPGSVHAGGSITAFFTVLVEGDDMTEPVADAVRGILDGHIILSRSLAQRGHFPAIDVLDSVSRVAGEICTPDHLAARGMITRLLAAHKEVEELLMIGAYSAGSNPAADAAIKLKPRIDALLTQTTSEARESFAESLQKLTTLAREASAMMQQPQGRGGGGVGPPPTRRPAPKAA